jgi:hypothetical protein
MSQTTYEQMSDRPLPFGSVFDSGAKDSISALNSDPGAAQVDTVTITNYVLAKTLTWTIDGVAFSYVMTAADADTTGVAASIIAQLQAEPIFGGRFYATHLLGVITLTARFPGVGWTILATGAWAADFTVANVTASAAGAALPYGRLVIDDGQVSGSINKKGKLGSAANLTAKVIHAVPVHVNTTTYTVSVTVKGLTYLAQFTSGGAATVKEIVEGLEPIINAMLPTQTVVVTEDDTHLLFTAELAGLDFDVAFGSSGATALWTVTDTGLKTDDVNEAAIGIALRSDSVETNSDTVPGYPANRAMSVLRQGRVVVQTPTLVVPSRGVWVRLATATATSPIGSFRDTAATDCVELDPRRFRWVVGASATRAVLQVSCD